MADLSAEAHRSTMRLLAKHLVAMMKVLSIIVSMPLRKSSVCGEAMLSGTKATMRSF